MIPHRSDPVRSHRECECSLVVQEIQILRAEPARPAKDLHRLTPRFRAAHEMDQGFAIEAYIKKGPPVREQFEGLRFYQPALCVRLHPITFDHPEPAPFLRRERSGNKFVLNPLRPKIHQPTMVQSGQQKVIVIDDSVSP